MPRGYDENNRPLYELKPSFSYRARGKIDGQPVINDYAVGQGFNEIGLIKHLEKVDVAKAYQIQSNYINSKERITELSLHKKNYDFNQSEIFIIANKYNWNLDVIKKLKLYRCDEHNEFTIPVINNGVVLSENAYYPKRETGKWVVSGKVQGKLIMNYDDWRYNKKQTIICEGAKDMITALSNGYNAISFLNGAKGVPDLYPAEFKGRDIVICYDNDEAGVDGAKKLAAWLFEKEAASIKILDISGVCIEKGEDLFDYFNKYNKTKEDFDKLIEETSTFNQNDYITITDDFFPKKSLREAKEKSNHNQYFQTDIQVRVEYSPELLMPEVATFAGTINGVFYRDTMIISEPRDFLRYATTEQKQKDKFKKAIISKIIKEKNIAPGKGGIIVLEDSLKISTYETIYRFDIADNADHYVDKEDTSVTQSQHCYTIGVPLERGYKYRVTYKITSHPESKSEAVMIVTKAVKLDSIDSDFSLLPIELDELKKFQKQEGQSVDEAMTARYNDMKNYIGKELDKNLYFANDLTFHSVFEYYQGDNLKKLGQLVTLIYGDAGKGKTWTFEHLGKLYNRGYYVTGNNTTTAGLLGGSAVQQNGQRKIEIGIAPTQDKGMLLIEEFTDANQDILTKITDLLTSGRTNISRVGEAVHITARCRWLFVANDKNKRTMLQYNSGFEPLRALFTEPQWERRLDIALAVVNDSSNDNFWDMPVFENQSTLLYDQRLYKLKIQWIWSRKADNVKIPPEVAKNVWKYAVKWCQEYGLIDLTGKKPGLFFDKLCRVAIACATMLFSTDDGINVKVTEEHFEWAFNFYKNIYDNRVFNIRNYLEREEKFIKINEGDLDTLQSIYNKFPAFIDRLNEQVEGVANGTLRLMFGSDDNSSFIETMGVLFKRGFLKPTKGGYQEVTEKLKSLFKDLTFDEKKKEKEETVVNDFDY